MVNTLLPAFLDPSSNVRQAVASAFWPFNGGNNIDPRVIDKLRQCLTDPSRDVREQAAIALSYIGEEVDGARIEQLLRQCEPLALRELRSYNGFFDALKRIAEKI